MKRTLTHLLIAVPMATAALTIGAGATAHAEIPPGPKDIAIAPKPKGPKDIADAPKPQKPQGPKDLAQPKAQPKPQPKPAQPKPAQPQEKIAPKAQNEEAVVAMQMRPIDFGSAFHTIDHPVEIKASSSGDADLTWYLIGGALVAATSVAAASRMAQRRN